ncbi:hypothetical protein [Micromonospora sp. DT233]
MARHPLPVAQVRHPWQGCDEWLLLLSAVRYEHSQFTAVRPVAPLPTR